MNALKFFLILGVLVPISSFALHRIIKGDENCDTPTQEKVIVEIDEYDSPTQTTMNYSYFLEGNTLKVGVNPIFNPVSPTLKHLPKNSYNYYYSRLAQCFEALNPFLKIENTNFKVELYIDEQAPKKLIYRRGTVANTENNIRSNRDIWAEDALCFTQVHEIFHILGLIDDYRDERYPSREVREGYILGDNFKFAEKVGGYKFEKCRAEPILIDSNKKIWSCPSGYSEPTSILFTSGERLEIGQFLYHPANPKEEFWHRGYTNLISEKVQGNSKFGLHAIHYNVIAYPGCRSKNNHYYQNANRF